MKHLAKIRMGATVKTLGNTPKLNRAKFVQRVCHAYLHSSGYRWIVRDYTVPSMVDYDSWLLATLTIRSQLSLFADLAKKYRNGKHGIRPKHLNGLKPDDRMCAIRRAIRDLPRVEVVDDVPIQRCIEWGILPEGMPTKWPKNV